MTRQTLVFLRDLCSRCTLNVKDDGFRQLALAMISALDELDAELADGGSPSGGADG